MTDIRVSALYCYPIKSCKGVALQQATTDARGIVGDRSMMVVDESGTFISQREVARLALIAPHLNDDGSLTLSAPAMPALTFWPSGRGPARPVRVWRDTCLAVDQGDHVAEWFSTFLDMSVRLVHIADDFVRHVDARYARWPTDQTAFADAYPFLLISQASLNALNARLPTPVPMNRFRPNIVVDGCPPFAEDEWRDFCINGITFSAVKPCARCVVTTIDQETAIASPEPLRTLASFRAKGQKVLFGQNVVADRPGSLRVGDSVTLLSV